MWLIEQRALGVCEKPDGSNNGPEISSYHSITQRDNTPGFGPWLAKAGGNWCASSASYCEHITRLEHDPGPVMTPRAAGWEIERDAKSDGTWRPAELIQRGEFMPEPGDIGTIQRGRLGSGLRHVFTIIENVPERNGVITIGGNEGNRFGEDVFRQWSSLHPEFSFLPRKFKIAIAGGPRDRAALCVHDIALTIVRDGMDPDPWTQTEWRGVRGHARRWRTTRAGISVKGEPGPRRTKGQPITMGKRWNEFGAEIREAHEATGVPIATIMATLQTESGGDPKAARYEKHLSDYSFGLMQTLTETAFAISRQLDVTAPRLPIPRGGIVSEWREFLFSPRNSILIGAAYLAYLDDHFQLLGDPVLLFSSFNAGSPRVDLESSWGTKYTRGESYDHVSVAAAWLGDSLAVIEAA